MGDLYGVILGDIPGLIEGAAEGKGLGHKFLRHIKRTKGLIHLVSSEEEDPIKTYKVVRKELELYNKEITKKPEIVLLTKVDLITDEEKEEKLKALKSVADEVHVMSVIDDNLIKDFKDALTRRATL